MSAFIEVGQLESKDLNDLTWDDVYEWDVGTQKKLLTYVGGDDEDKLDDLLRDYSSSLQTIARDVDDEEYLRNRVASHVNFLHSLYSESGDCSLRNYLSNMEEILVAYCNLELRLAKKRTKWVCKRIIWALTMYLFQKTENVLHVLMKLDTEETSEGRSAVLRGVYKHFLTQVPVKNLSDESFCRYYIVFQKWKETLIGEYMEKMDKFMYKLLKRTPESVISNEKLKRILMPAGHSTVDVALNLSKSVRHISDAYFKYMTSNSPLEKDCSNSSHLKDEEQIVVLDDDGEGGGDKFLVEVGDLSNLSSNLDVKVESDSVIKGECEPVVVVDDDVEVGGESSNLCGKMEEVMSELPFRTCKTEVEDDVVFIGTSTPNPTSPLQSNSIDSCPFEFSDSSTSGVSGISDLCKSPVDILSQLDESKDSNCKEDVESNSSLSVDNPRLPTVVPETYDFNKNLKNEVFSELNLQNLDATKLPLKKRKMSMHKYETRREPEICYPATPMISIAELAALHPKKLGVKTAAQRKEMPPLPAFYNRDSGSTPVIGDPFTINTHTYNNPTINYHMNNVPFISLPGGSYYSLPPILLPFNNMSGYEQDQVNPQEQEEQYAKKETRKQWKQKKR